MYSLWSLPSCFSFFTYLLSSSVFGIVATCLITEEQCLIADFRREVAENYALLGYYATNRGNFLPTFRDNLSVLSSGIGESPMNSGSFPG